MKSAEEDGRDTGFGRDGGEGKVTGREGRVLPLGRCGRERRRRQEAGGVQVGIKGGAGTAGRSKDGCCTENAGRALAWLAGEMDDAGEGQSRRRGITRV